jgi:hypothetical protein
MAEEWREHLSTSSTISQQDSVEYLESALSKWRFYEDRDRAVDSEKALIQSIKNDSTIDALGMLTIHASWANLKESLGFCQFRRTWSNNLTIDFLAVHPALLLPKPPISGVGTALLYYVSTLARRIGAKRVWLETTDVSVNYYSYLFGTSKTSDLLNIPVAKFHKRLTGFFGKK